MGHRAGDGIEQLRNRTRPLNTDAVGGMSSPATGTDHHDAVGLVDLAANSGDRFGHVGVIDRKNGSYND